MRMPFCSAVNMGATSLQTRLTSSSPASALSNAAIRRGCMGMVCFRWAQADFSVATVSTPRWQLRRLNLLQPGMT
jgi:hypothetical protein